MSPGTCSNKIIGNVPLTGEINFLSTMALEKGIAQSSRTYYNIAKESVPNLNT